MFFGAMWKHLLWIAPVTAFIFWYVSQKQEQAETKQEVRQSSFDRDFAQMNKEFEGGSDHKENAKYWEEKGNKLEKEQAKKEAKAEKVETRSDEMTKSLHNEEDQITDKDLQELGKMSKDSD